MVFAAHESPSTSQSGRDLKASCKFEVIQHNIRHAFKEEAFRMLAANTVNRILRLSGLNIQRWHDPLFDLQSLTGKDAIATMLDGGAYKGNKAIIMLEDRKSTRLNSSH